MTISNTVQAAGIDRPGINLGGLTAYGPQQLFKSLNYAVGGYMPGTYWASTFQCNAGGTANSTTSWFNNIYNTNGYSTNWWVGASFVAINTATGTSYGSGNITGSTANTGGTGTTFTLSPAISAACNPAQNDVLIVRLNATNRNFTPSQVNSGTCAAATWDTADTDPLSTNTQQSLEMPSGCVSSYPMDQVLLNASNPVSSLATQFVPWINLNGSYTAGFKAKCLVAGCSIGWSVARGGSTYVAYNTVNPAANATAGAGWTTYATNFTAAETGAQGASLNMNLVCTGTCLVQDVDVIEGSTMAGNTTVFRDAIVYELQKIHPGSIRYMDGTQWCSDVADEIASMGNRRWCGASEYVNWLEGPPIGYGDVLALANLIGSDAFISVGLLNQASDWTTLINWLNTSGWTATFASTGHHIYLEDGNEAWNTGVPATLFQGNGKAYGYTLGLKMAAAKAANGYNSSVIKLVGDSWNAGTQGYSAFGWLSLSLGAAGCTINSKTTCPDFVDNAPYTLDYLGSTSIIGTNVSATGAPFVDAWAEIANVDSVTSPPANATSVFLNQQYAKSVFGLDTAVYEVNESTTNGIAVTQLQLNQIDSSVGNALVTAEHILLMQRDSKVAGPIHAFTLAGPYNGYNGSVTGTAMPLWGTAAVLATGPGQAPGAANVDRPLNIALEVINNAIGSNTNLVSAPQSGTPTYGYPGGQPQNGANTILANSAVPYVNCFVYTNGAQTSWTTICFNNNLTSSESVMLAGVGAPTGSVTQTIFPNASNVITDNNEATFLGTLLSAAPAVTYPSSTTTNGTSFTIPPASMIALSYFSGTSTGSPTLATPTFSPGTGNYAATQTVTVSLPSGSTGCVGINTTPTAPTPGTCGSGSSNYSGPITVSTSETLNVIATAAGSTNSAVGTATYTIAAPTAATPTFSPVGGTYATSQTVTISDTTPGATLYYTTNGSTPTTSSAVYTSPITVSTSETIQAIAVATNYSTSVAGSATYTLNLPAAATPTFSPVAGTYASAQTVTISDATAGATLYYTTNGSTPTTSSTVYSGPITVSATETLQAIAVATGYSNSAAGTAAFTINTTAAGTPTFSPAGGTYTTVQTVTISDTTAGATIYFTMNGSTPTTSSTIYTGPITVSATETVQALAVASGVSNSTVGTAAYTINTTPAATPILSPSSGTYTSAQTVTVSDTTAGATLYYTTNGSTPTASSTVYTGPITVSTTETLQVLAMATGFANSAVATAVYNINLAAATPVFSPAAGTYTSAQTVAISDVTAGATLYYTTNGSTPTTSSAVYAGPITVSATETVQAIAVVSGYTNSAVGTAAYTINLPAAATPNFSPVAGTYAAAQTVTISDATTGATIYYTTNGSTPTTASAAYTGPITVSATETLEAIAVATGYTTSAVGSAAYTINLSAAATPNFSPVAGTYASPQTVTISDTTAGATLYYTTNGSTPTTSSAVYSGPLTVSATETLQAIAVATGYSNSAVASVAYTITTQAATPAFSPGAGTYSSAQTVIISDATAGATLYYTTNGSTPTTSSTVYSGPIAVSASETIQAIAAAPGFTNSAVSGSAYTINAAVTSTPNFLPAGGTYTSTQTVTIGSATPGALIYYTTNGTTPTTGSTLYNTALTVSSTELVQAIAVAPGYSASTVGAAGYTITAAAAASPAFSPAGGTYTSTQTVTISDATAGATIYYTTNGATPTASSTPYAGPISVATTETVKAIAVATGYSNSAVASASYTITPPAAAPTFSPAAGSYTSAQTVTISDATTGATLYYTTNGSTPTTSSAVYSGPITVSTTETLQAIAVATGYSNSVVGSAAYTITTQAATPVFSPVGGTYTSIQTVAITDSTPGVTLYYTTNGATPTTSSAVYAGPITVSATETLQAIAVATGYSNSAVGSAAYIINIAAAATPVFSPAGGTYTSVQTVTISDATAGATIYYTTNGSAPTTSSAVYSGPITISASETLEAIAVATGFSTSAVGTAAYTITLQAATPVLSPGGGSYTSAQTVTISDATAGTTIYYTTNGAAPTTGSTVYSGPIIVSASETVQAIAVAAGYSNSAVASAAYSITLTTAATPNFSPVAGTYASAQTVSISDATAGATLYYTTNGSTPTTSSPVYTGPIAVSANETLEAIAVATGFSNSATGIAAYIINTTPAATPTFSPGAGTYASAQTVTISDATPGVKLYYTTNGSMPTSSSAVYSGPIVVSASETLEAVAIETGYPDSAVGSAAFTISLPAATPTFSPGTGTYSSSQTVTISDTTAGAVIYYTTNGAPPTTSSSVYSGPITVSGSETVEAIAVASGYSTSAVGAATYTISLLPAETPAFSPAPGTYSSPQTVSLSDATAGAVIYYTTNGATPTTSSTVYSGPITVSATETLRAIATATGYSNSAVASAVFTINLQTATPSFSPGSGTYTTAQTVAISDGTAGAAIYYTTNGAKPTTSSALYAGPLSVSTNETLEAIAVAPGYTNSNVGSAAFTINPLQASTPNFSPGGGTYSNAQTVTISDATAGAAIYYTTNGSTPTTSSAVYSGSITISSSELLQAIAVATGFSTSTVGTAGYVINVAPASTPNFSLAAGTYTTTQTLALSDLTAGATIYYTTNGSTPTTSSAVYTGPILVSASELVQAVAAAPGYSSSAVGSAAYTINSLPVATPTFSLGSGTYTSSQVLVMADTSPGALIYYTTNGLTPTTSSAVYSGPITISSTETVQAIAVAAGYPNSAVTAAAYTINLVPAATPLFSLGTATYTSIQTVTLSDTTPGAVIYYTTDGSFPNTSSLIYTGPVTVFASETLEAIAVASGYPISAIAYAVYTINLIPTSTPTFSPIAGLYTSAQTVTLGDATSGATIYYTTDGSTPTTNSAVYTSPISVSVSETIQALAVAAGYPNSAVGSAAYTINLAPIFTITVAPTQLFLGAGQSAVAAVTVTPTNLFTSAVTFTCGNLPSGATCTFSPATVTPGGKTATTSLTVTMPASIATLRPSRDLLLSGGSTFAVALCLLGFRKRRRLRLLLVALLALGLSVGATGCATGYKTSTINVIATSGSTQATAVLQLVVSGS